MSTKGNLSALVKPRSRGNGDIVSAKSREPIPSVKGLSERKVESQSSPFPAGFGPTYPVRAISGVRREIDGCNRTLSILFEFSDGVRRSLDYSLLLDEANWTDG